MNILDLPMDRNDAGAATVREYLVKLALQVWIEEEGFSSKRPFGNSGWQSEVYRAMIDGGAIEGDSDKWPKDERAAHAMVQKAILSLGAAGGRP